MTAELTKELQAFILEQQRRLKAFRMQLTSQRKAFEQERQGKEITTPKPANTVRPNAPISRYEEGVKACRKFTSDSEYRACMKPFLRNVDVYGRSKIR